MTRIPTPRRRSPSLYTHTSLPLALLSLSVLLWSAERAAAAGGGTTVLQVFTAGSCDGAPSQTIERPAGECSQESVPTLPGVSVYATWACNVSSTPAPSASPFPPPFGGLPGSNPSGGGSSSGTGAGTRGHVVAYTGSLPQYCMLIPGNSQWDLWFESDGTCRGADALAALLPFASSAQMSAMRYRAVCRSSTTDTPPADASSTASNPPAASSSTAPTSVSEQPWPDEVSSSSSSSSPVGPVASSSSAPPANPTSSSSSSSSAQPTPATSSTSSGGTLYPADTSTASSSSSTHFPLLTPSSSTAPLPSSPSSSAPQQPPQPRKNAATSRAQASLLVWVLAAAMSLVLALAPGTRMTA